jgi:hypothetical protein
MFIRITDIHAYELICGHISIHMHTLLNNV